MTAYELLQREPEKIEKIDWGTLKGCYFNHVPEFPDFEIDTDFEKVNLRLRARVYKDFNFDGRRYWRLAVICFDGDPVMIIQNAGREGDDHSKRFILAKGRYLEMVNYLYTCVRKDVVDEMTDKDVIQLDQEMGDKLTKFYGNELDGHFQMSRY